MALETCFFYRINMLDVSEIRDVHSPIFGRMYDLYQSAFVSVERRTYDGLVKEILDEPLFHSLVFLKDEKFVGFLNYWNFEQFWYIEHFAVDADFRNQQIGTEAMKLFLKSCNLPLLFEVEMPVNDFAKRRIRFYERFGFSVIDKKYAQPPSNHGNSDFLPELLMSNAPDFVNLNFVMIKATLYQQVYHYFET